MEYSLSSTSTEREPDFAAYRSALEQNLGTLTIPDLNTLNLNNIYVPLNIYVPQTDTPKCIDVLDSGWEDQIYCSYTEDERHTLFIHRRAIAAALRAEGKKPRVVSLSGFLEGKE